MYDLGDLVYYKKKDSDKWKEPGKVLGKKKQILVKNRGYYVSAYPCS